ncbi:MAG: PhoH family protein [Candidatus Competibacteraceae bacterium]
MQGEQEWAFLVRSLQHQSAIIEVVKDYTGANHAVWGITARNREQNFCPEPAPRPRSRLRHTRRCRTGKTLLALAAGTTQTLDQNRYREIIMTRVTVPVGEDIGFLPGTEEEKMTPWMGALMDNLEVLSQTQEGGEWGRAATQNLLGSQSRSIR